MMSFLSNGGNSKKLIVSHISKDKWREDADWVPVDDEDCIGVRDSDVNIYMWPKRRLQDDYDA